MNKATYRVDVETAEFEHLSPEFKALSGYTLEDVSAMGGRVAFLNRVTFGDIEDTTHWLDPLGSEDPGTRGTAHYWIRHKDGSSVRVADEWALEDSNGRNVIHGTIRALDAGAGASEELTSLVHAQFDQIWRQRALIRISDAIQEMRHAHDIEGVSRLIWREFSGAGIAMAGLVIHRVIDPDVALCDSYRLKSDGEFDILQRTMDLNVQLWRAQESVYHQTMDCNALLEVAEATYGAPIGSVLHFPLRDGLVSTFSRRSEDFEEPRFSFVKSVSRLISIGLTRFGDLTEVENQARQARAHLGQLNALLAVNKTIQGMRKAGDIEAVSRTVWDKVCSLGIDLAGIVIHLVKDSDDDLCEAYRLTARRFWSTTRTRPLIADVWRKGETVLQSTPGEVTAHTSIQRMYGERIGSVLNLPVSVGVIGFLSRTPNDFDPSRVTFLQDMAESISVGIARFLDLTAAADRAAEANIRSERQAALLEIGDAVQKMTDSADVEVVARIVLHSLIGADVDAAGLVIHRLLDESVSRFESFRVAQEGGVSREIQEIPFVLDVWASKEDLRFVDLETEAPQYFGPMREKYGTPVHSVVNVPTYKGVIAVSSSSRDAFSESEIAFFCQVADIVSIGLTRLDDIEALAARNADLIESEGRYRELFESANDTVYTHDLEGRFTSINRAGEILTGYDREELLGASYEVLLAPEYIPVARDMMTRKLADPSARTRYEAQVICKDGSRVAVEINSSILELDGVPTAILGVARDISERKQTERELVRIQRLNAIGELAAGVSHNLNNMLTGVLGPAQMLARLTDDENTRRESQVIVDNTLRAAELVQRLNQSVRGGDPDQVQPVDLNQVCEGAVQTAEPKWRDEAQSQGASIVIDQRLQRDLPPVRATATGVHDAVINLILNAVDAMPDGGRIVVKSRTEADRVTLEVTDTGIGMARDVADRVFEPFFTTKADVGTGLGLSTVYASMQAWGGEATVTSEVGRGTTFVLTFQIAQPEEVCASDEPGRKDAPEVRRGRVMIVDDDDTVRELVRAMIAAAGHEVEAFGGGSEALAAFSAGRYDVALLDLSMPEISGDYLAVELRKLDMEIGLVLMSGWVLDENDERARRFDVQIQKPFVDIADVGSVIAQAIRLKDQRGGQV